MEGKTEQQPARVHHSQGCTPGERREMGAQRLAPASASHCQQHRHAQPAWPASKGVHPLLSSFAVAGDSARLCMRDPLSSTLQVCAWVLQSTDDACLLDWVGCLLLVWRLWRLWDRAACWMVGVLLRVWPGCWVLLPGACPCGRLLVGSWRRCTGWTAWPPKGLWDEDQQLAHEDMNVGGTAAAAAAAAAATAQQGSRYRWW